MYNYINVTHSSSLIRLYIDAAFIVPSVQKIEITKLEFREEFLTQKNIFMTFESQEQHARVFNVLEFSITKRKANSLLLFPFHELNLFATKYETPR